MNTANQRHQMLTTANTNQISPHQNSTMPIAVVPWNADERETSITLLSQAIAQLLQKGEAHLTFVQDTVKRGEEIWQKWHHYMHVHPNRRPNHYAKQCKPLDVYSTHPNVCVCIDSMCVSMMLNTT